MEVEVQVRLEFSMVFFGVLGTACGRCKALCWEYCPWINN